MNIKLINNFSGRLLVLSLSILVLLGGCSSLKVIESWHQSGKAGKQYRKLMIMAVLNDETRRKVGEDIVVSELQHKGIVAVASHTYIKNLDNPKRDDVLAAVKAAGADGLITVRPISIGDRKVTQEGQDASVYGTFGSGPTYLTGGSFTTTPGATTMLEALLQTNLYDYATTELVWTATVKTFDADREARVSRDLAKFFMEQLRKDGFL